MGRGRRSDANCLHIDYDDNEDDPRPNNCDEDDDEEEVGEKDANSRRRRDYLRAGRIRRGKRGAIHPSREKLRVGGTRLWRGNGSAANLPTGSGDEGGGDRRYGRVIRTGLPYLGADSVLFNAITASAREEEEKERKEGERKIRNGDGSRHAYASSYATGSGSTPCPSETGIPSEKSRDQ